MKKMITSILFLVIAAVVSAATLEIRTTEFKNFKIGEVINFKVTAKADDGALLKDGKFNISLKYCGQTALGKPIAIDLAKGNPASFTAKLDKPGFIFAEPSAYKTADGKTNKWKYQRHAPYFGGAAVEPEKIRQAGTVPADFDKFWQDGLANYKNAKITVTPDPETKRAGYKVFRVKVFFIDGSGSINGFLSIPEGKGKFPAVVGVPGAGPGVVSPKTFIRTSKKAIELYMNVHPYETAKTSAEMLKNYRALNKSCSTKAYQHEFAWDRDKYIYRKVWLALSRAVDYVAQLPEYDGKHMAAAGNSQGGATALAMGYLNKNVTCVAATVPALCDHHGFQLGRRSGWPRLHAALKGRADKVMPYFDCATFAAKLKVPTIMTVGYVDTTCSPSSVYAAFNNIKSPKQIFPMYTRSHAGSPQGFKAVTRFLDKQLTK